MSDGTSKKALSNEITIDLTGDLNTKPFNEINLIQKEAQTKLVGILKKQVYASVEFLNNEKISYSFSNFNRVHNCILIDGKRGYGKTSFILSVLNEIKTNEKKIDASKEIAWMQDIEILPVFDPTITETKEHVFISIIAMMDKLTNKCRCGNSEHDVKGLTKAREEIAKGLTALDGVGENSASKWNDDKIILSEGIDKSRGGMFLEQHFHEYIRQCLKIMKKKAFILVFDDIDTSIDKGKLILELIRKYLTSPNLITIILGDMNLFNLLGRELQWKKMHPEFTAKYEKDNINGLFSAEIDNLTDQYLLKVINPNNRVHLKLLQQLKSNLKVKSLKSRKIDADGKDQDSDLDSYLENLIKQVFAELNETDIQVIKSQLLTQPVRTILSFLIEYDKSSDEFKSASLVDYFMSGLGAKYNTYQLSRIIENSENSQDNTSFLQELINYFILIKENDFNLSFDLTNSQHNLLRFIINSALVSSQKQAAGRLNQFVCLSKFETLKDNLKDNSKDNSKDFIGEINIVGMVAKYGLQTISYDRGVFKVSEGNIGTLFGSSNKLLVNFITLIHDRQFTRLGDELQVLSIWKLLDKLIHFLNNTNEEFYSLSIDNNIIPDESSEGIALSDFNQAMKEWKGNINTKYKKVRLSPRVIQDFAINFSNDLTRLGKGNLFDILQNILMALLNRLLIASLDEKDDVARYSQLSNDQSGNISKNINRFKINQNGSSHDGVGDDGKIKFVVEFMSCPLFKPFWSGTIPSNILSSTGTVDFTVEDLKNINVSTKRVVANARVKVKVKVKVKQNDKAATLIAYKEVLGKYLPEKAVEYDKLLNALVEAQENYINGDQQDNRAYAEVYKNVKTYLGKSFRVCTFKSEINQTGIKRNLADLFDPENTAK